MLALFADENAVEIILWDGNAEAAAHTVHALR